MTRPENRKLLKTGLAGLAVTALCCFTPILVTTLGIIGLGAITGYLDYILLPLMCVFVIMIAYSIVAKAKCRQ